MSHKGVREVKRVQLIAELQSSCSGAEAFLGLASDGNEYWVKAPDNPQGARTLVAEAIVYGIGHAIGAPVPENVLIDIPPGFSKRYADGRLMKPGLGHGSLNVANVIESDDWSPYSTLDHNRVRQAYIFALWDLCLGVDPQWLHETTREFSMWSFDHGMWLAGEIDWDVSSLRHIGAAPWHFELDCSVTSKKALAEVADRVARLSFETIEAITRQVPVQWNTHDQELRDVAQILSARVQRVANSLRSSIQLTKFP